MIEDAEEIPSNPESRAHYSRIQKKSLKGKHAGEHIQCSWKRVLSFLYLVEMFERDGIVPLI